MPQAIRADAGARTSRLAAGLLMAAATLVQVVAAGPGTSSVLTEHLGLAVPCWPARRVSP
jgi:hypothetical protein